MKRKRKKREEVVEAIQAPIESKEYEYQVFLSTINGQQGIAKVMAKDLEDAREKIKPNVLIGAFVVLGTVENNEKLTEGESNE
jgi:hypothetical protein